MPLLVALEGLDGAGKSTMARQIQERLGNNRCTIFAFPRRSTPSGKILDRYLRGDTDKDTDMDAWSLHMLFLTNLWEAVAEVRRELAEGRHVVLDRWYYSTIAYSAARGVPMRWATKTCNQLPRPDVVVFVDRLPLLASDAPEVTETEAMQERVYASYNELWQATTRALELVFATRVSDVLRYFD